MSIKCKNCGKQFTLSNGEIEFYKSKNLNIPKRCKDCRQANKSTKNNCKLQNQYSQSCKKSKSSQYANSSILLKVVVAVLIFIIAFVTIPNLFNNESQPSIGNYVTESTFAFRNEDYLSEHYEKHGKGMGYNSASEYLQGANSVIASNSVMTKTQSDSDTAYFLQSSGEFVVVSHDGYIRTYFIPEDGIEYFNRQ